jgi:uncharacterized protein YdhG (YjbR/CyaY superfamily)
MSTEKIDAYLSALSEDRKGVMEKLIAVMKKNLPKGFSLDFSYGMIGFCVPHSIYPKGYHCDSKIALPFVSIASQKNFIALYHMGIYAEPTLLDWFVAEYPKHVKSKLDMGKSCIRFKKMEEIPFDLIGELMKKMSPQQWIDLYESKFVK